ncbi:MAG: bacillithiol system redox-active protein YtxJ [Bacteroidetes bacterium]|nr:bacillithiol system redox-active protein YtxJ [Bacteroidota bacterium]
MSWWKFLTNDHHLNELIEVSKTKPVLIYKHSTRCSTCLMTKRVIEGQYQGEIINKLNIYFLDLIAYRSISNDIALRFHVEHESPQILLIKDGKCVFHASHEDCSLEFLNLDSLD